LEYGGLFCIQIKGGQQHCTGLQIDITGTEGVLRITNLRAFENKDEQPRRRNECRGVVPNSSSGAVKYHSLPEVSHLDASVQDVAYLYAAYAHDKKNGTSEASNFKDAVLQHHLLDEIVKTSEGFFNRRPN
jgi:predicted dehydrogenase